MVFGKLMFCVAIVLFCGCNNTAFQGGGSKKPATVKKETPKPIEQPRPDDKVEIIPQDDNTVVESFSIDAKEKSKIDMVWAIDNSGSMIEEAKQVRKNLELFVASLNQQNNVKLALLSSTEEDRPSTGVTLSEAARQAGHLQVIGAEGIAGGGVNSTDALVAMASAVTDEVVPETNTGGFGRDNHPGFAGKLKDFFRPDAKSVFVIVTDDDAERVDDSNFLQRLDGKIPDKNPLVYGFIGTGGSTCDIARVGNAYVALAGVTKGETYDICQEDWQQHFAKLTSHVQESVTSEFVLRSPDFETVFSVVLDGTPLARDVYSVDGQKLIIKEGVLKPSHKRLEVTLKMKP